jgi:hypothetical protein
MLRLWAPLAGASILIGVTLMGQVQRPAEEYHIYTGSTHAHTAYTWSHGEQFTKNGCAGIMVYGPDAASPPAFTWSDGYVKSTSGCAGIYVINSFQYPSPSVTLKKDWNEFQGAPSVHFNLAKSNGYDFYVTTDHSQEAAFQPADASNLQWMASKRDAAAASGSGFVALAGFEYSENDGPGGTGHINVINSSGMLNALAPGIDLPYFYKWLATAEGQGGGPVVASFNHPTPDQYNNWAYRDPKVTEILTMLEVINSNNKIHYEGFVNALDKGWKVAPVCGNDNHGTAGISKNASRTFVLAKEPTKAAILDAMKNRRVYAAMDKTLQCRYTVNGAIMGSTLQGEKTFKFDISVSHPNSTHPRDMITKIDIVKDGGIVAQEYQGNPGHSLRWTPTIEDATAKYFFVRVWTIGGGDAPGADPAKPMAWLAPVWTGR